MKQTQQPRPFRVRRAGLFLLALALAAPGCASIAEFNAMRSIPVAGPNNPVVDFACIWQQGEGRDEKGKPCRGFCGQLMFRTGAGGKPGIVHGAVTIYVFDNVGTLEEQTRPFKSFEFTADEWATFQRRTNLGMTYQLFIPYTRPGGREADCQIHVKFTPVGGLPIYSHPETISLRGAGGAGAMADSLDRKLTSSSKLFQNPAIMTPASIDPAYAELVRKMRTETATSTTSKPSSSAADPLPQKQPDISRLQAVLDASASNQVQQADYAEDSAHNKRRVSQAVHEELQ